MTPPIFKVPELVALLVEYLSPHDIATLVLANQEVKREVEPWLFFNLVIAPPLRHPTLDYKKLADKTWALTRGVTPFSLAVRRHIDDVRRMDITFFADAILTTILEGTLKEATGDGINAQGNKYQLDATATAALAIRKTDFRRLSRLRILVSQGRFLKQTHSDAICPDFKILLLLGSNSSLTHVTLPSAFLRSSDGVVHLANLVNTGLPRLHKLTFAGPAVAAPPDYIPVYSISALLRACLCLPSLQHLEFDSDVLGVIGEVRGPFIAEDSFTEILEHWGSAKNTHQKARADHATSSPMVSSLRSLILPRYFPGRLVLYILENYVPHLSRFSVPCHAPQHADAIRNAIRHHCPKLQHIILDDRSTNHEVDRRMVSSVLEACEQSIGEDGRIGVISLHITGYREFAGMLKFILTRKGTLQELVFERNKCLPRIAVMRILETCSQLERFSIPLHWFSRTMIYLPDRETIVWACRKLKVLSLKVSSEIIITDKPSSEEEERQIKQWALRQLYCQIGAQVDLEDLGLTFGRTREEDDFMLSLPTSFTVDLALQYLRGLKKLRILRITQEMWEGMGEEEVEFIAQEWPSLVEIEFYTKTCVWNAYKVSHWGHFKELRPEVKLTNSDAYPLEP